MSAAPRLAGVMGWPVGHTLSPRLHGFWLQQLGLPGAYVPLAVEPARLEAAVRGLPALGFAGANVTLPHKQAVLGFCDRVEPLAQRLGAVNTLVVQADGSIFGRNTDAPGFLAALQAAAPAWQADVGPVTVLGGGGGARAVVAALGAAGCPQIRLVNRSALKAEGIASDMPDLPIAVLPWEARAAALEGAAGLVNTTQLGMRGQPALEIDLAPLPAGAWVCDIVYVPLETPLLAAARARGLLAVDGLGMLLHQGVAAFEAFFGAKPEVTTELRAFMLQATGN